MEAKERGEKEPQIVFFENPTAANLEHVLPRTPSSGWKIPTDVARAYYKRIGNLTILDPSVNVEIGNESFDVKRQAYKKSPFLITKAIGAKRTWEPEDIEEIARARREVRAATSGRLKDRQRPRLRARSAGRSRRSAGPEDRTSRPLPMIEPQHVTVDLIGLRGREELIKGGDQL